jgi:hypothetical protein
VPLYKDSLPNLVTIEPISQKTATPATTLNIIVRDSLLISEPNETTIEKLKTPQGIPLRVMPGKLDKAIEKAMDVAVRNELKIEAQAHSFDNG